MKNTVTVNLFFILLLMLPVSLSASDFGLVVNSNCGYDNAFTKDNTFNYKVDILPRFSTLVGGNGEFVLSAGFSIANEEGFFYIPEILRTEFNIRFGSSGVRIGRFNFSDPSSFVVSGLFDGIQYYQNSNGGSFRIGAWYTGFLYKKRANILMTDNDEAAFLKPFEYGDFFDAYFASRRVISSVEWEHPSIGEFLRLNTAYVGQTDLNKADTKYHSQYLIVKAGIPIDNLLMEFGGVAEFSRTVTAKESEFNMAFAGDIGLFLLFPSEFNSRLSFKGIIAGGRIRDFTEAFNPITAHEYGYILKAKLSGLSIFSLDYSAKFNNFFSGSVTASYFVRNDLGTFHGYPLTKNSVEYFLGPEAAAQIIWSPASDLHFKFGGGAFFPLLGDLFSEEKIKGRFDFTVILSIL